MQQQQQHQLQFEDYGSPATAGIAPPFSASRSFSGTSPFPSFPSPQVQIPPVPSLPTPGAYSLSSSPLPPPVTPGNIKSPSTELDLNDPSTLEIYSRILLFKDDPMRDELAFSRTLSAKQRRVVHLVAQKLGVYHYSVGEGEDRYAVVTRIDPSTVSSPSLASTCAISSADFTATTAPECPRSSDALSRSFVLLDRCGFPNAIFAYEEVHARYEVFAVSGTSSRHPCFQWQYSRGIRNHRISIEALSWRLRRPLRQHRLRKRYPSRSQPPF